MRSGSAKKRQSDASGRLLSVPGSHLLATSFRLSFPGPARSREPTSLRARLRTSLPGRVLPGCCSSGSVLGAGGSGWGVRGRTGPCFGGARFSGGQRRVSARRAGERVPARAVAAQALSSVPAAAAALDDPPQHSLRGDSIRAPGALGGRDRAASRSREGRLTWLWTHRVTLAVSLRLGSLGPRVCEERCGGLPGPRWAWSERTRALHGVGVQQVSNDRSRYFIGRPTGVSETLPSVCDALGSVPSPQHHR